MNEEIMKKILPDWVLYAKQDREIIEASLKYWQEDVKDSIHYTDEEKIIFVLMDCIARTKESVELNKIRK